AGAHDLRHHPESPQPRRGRGENRRDAPRRRRRRVVPALKRRSLLHLPRAGARARRSAARRPAQNRGGLSALAAKELHLLLDSSGALIVYQEEGTHWAGVLGFSSEARAREFVAASHLDAAETAAIDPA